MLLEPDRINSRLTLASMARGKLLLTRVGPPCGNNRPERASALYGLAFIGTLPATGEREHRRVVASWWVGGLDPRLHGREDHGTCAALLLNTGRVLVSRLAVSGAAAAL